MSRAMAHNKHNQYGDYDYGLIELEEDLEFSERVQSIKLADADYENIAAGTKCVVSGWGDTHSPNESSSILRAANVPIVSEKECIDIYDKLITPRMICADYREGGISRKLVRIRNAIPVEY